MSDPIHLGMHDAHHLHTIIGAAAAYPAAIVAPAADSWNLYHEVVKSLLAAAISLASIGVGWIVGNRLAVRWAIIQRRKEIDLATATQFYQLYGEFFAIWKIWNQFVESRVTIKNADDTYWELLKRAASAEAGMEAIFVKLTAEHDMESSHTEVLGRFRQAYQQLRQSIASNRALEWYTSDHAEYITFKRLSCLISSILLDASLLKPKKRNKKIDVSASTSLEEITSNAWENSWIIDSRVIDTKILKDDNKQSNKVKR